QVLGHQVFAQHQTIQVTGQGANDAADNQSFPENIQGVAEHIALAPGNNPLEHQNRKQGTHRVNNNAFPAQYIGQLGARAHRAQQWRNNGGAGHNGYGTEKQSYGPGNVQDPARRQRADNTRNNGPHGDKITGHLAVTANVIKA